MSVYYSQSGNKETIVLLSLSSYTNQSMLSVPSFSIPFLFHSQSVGLCTSITALVKAHVQFTNFITLYEKKEDTS